MQSSTRSMLTVWSLAFVALVGNAVLASFNVNSLIDNDELLAHTRQVQHQLDLLQSTVKGAETGQRGFQLTGKEEYLEPYDRALAAMPKELTALDRLVLDNPEQMIRLSRLKGSLGFKMNELKALIELRRADRLEAALARMNTDVGKKAMDAIREEIAEMHDVEENLYSERSAVARAKYRITSVTNILGAVITIGMVGFAYRVVGRELRRRRIVEDTLRETNARLDLSRQVTAETLAQLDAFLQNAPVGIAFLDLQMRYVRINRYLAEANNSSIGVHIGRTPQEVLPEYPDEIVSEFQRTLETGQPILNRVLEGNPLMPGSDRHWQMSIFPVRDALQKKIGLGMIAQDISERIETERALKRSESEFRTLAESVPMVVWACRADGYNDYFNSQWYAYTGAGIGETQGFEWSSVTHPDDRDRAEARWAASVATGDDYEIEFRIRGADGAYRWFASRASAQRDDEGRVLRWFGTCMDIEDAKRVEAELRESLDRFTTLTESIPQMVFTTKPDGEVSFYNRRWIDYTGITVEAGRKGDWMPLVHPDDLAELAARWERTIAENGNQFSAEFRLQNHGRTEYRWMLCNTVAVRDPAGAILQWVGTMTDIQDQKMQSEILEGLVERRTTELLSSNEALRLEVEERTRAEQREKAWSLELRRSNGELEKFAYVASHDLQEPLRKIQAFGNRLAQKYAPELAGQGQEYIARMLDSAARMRQLIDDLLSYSRITTATAPFKRVDLAEVARTVVSDLEVRIHQTGADVRIGQLPALFADPTQMRQLLQNLVGNALKFHKPDENPVVSVECDPIGSIADVGTDNVDYAEAAPSHYRLTVSDNGIGFDEKYLDRIFEVFQRLHGREEYEGTGVGLAICRKIAERHGGSITARSTLGGGAAFEVLLSARPAQESPS